MEQNWEVEVVENKRYRFKTFTVISSAVIKFVG